MQRLKALFKENAGLQALASQAGQLTALQNICDAALPPALHSTYRVASLRNRRITVLAANGAVAARIKLLAPSLLKNLQIKGLEVTSIRVEVQVNSARKRPPKPPRRLSRNAAESLAVFADSLPDSPLRTALQQLAQKT